MTFQFYFLNLKVFRCMGVNPCSAIFSRWNFVGYPLCFSKPYWGKIRDKLSINLSLITLAIIEAQAMEAEISSPLIIDLEGVSEVSFTASMRRKSGFCLRFFMACCMANFEAWRIFILSISRASTIPTAQSMQLFTIRAKNSSLFPGVSFFESLSLSM